MSDGQTDAAWEEGEKRMRNIASNGNDGLAYSIDDTTPADWDSLRSNRAKVRASRGALDVQVGGGHYKDLKIQPVEYNHANNIPFLEGNIIKYATRHKSKGKEQDIKKIIHNCQLLLKLDYGIELNIDLNQA